MKANRRSAPLLARAPFLLTVTALAALASSCSQRIIPPAPAPLPAPRPAQRPAQRPATPAPPPPMSRPALDWRQAPITPGDWSWRLEGGHSVARFAGGALVLRCDRASRTITLQRAGAIPGPQPMTVTTTAGARTLTAAPLPGGGFGLALRANDPLLDMMIFSRGRFAIETPGTAPLYVPSWPEVSRVTEDCR